MTNVRKGFAEFMNMERSDKNVGIRVMKGAFLLTGGRLLLRLSSLVSLMVLARLLTPADYGIVSLAISVMGLLQIVTDVRVNQALIGLKEIDQRHLNTAFTLSLARGAIVSLLLLLFADVIASLTKQPALAPVLRTLAIVPLLDGLRNPSFVMFQRNIDFSREFKRQTIATITSSLLTIAAAIYLRSYWAIVFGTLILRSIEMGLTYWRVPHRIGFGLANWREFVGFGGWLTLAGIFDYISITAPQFLLGRTLGANRLGEYTVGRELSTIATRELAFPLATAIYPGLSAISHDPNRLRRAYREAQSTILGIALPIGLGSAMLARELIFLLAGEKWLQAAPVIETMAPLMAIGMINSGTNALALAKGQTRALFNRSLLMALTSYPMFAAGLWLGGFQGLLYVVGLRTIVAIGVTMRLGSRIVGDDLLSPIYASWRSIVAGAAMCLLLAWLPRADVDGASIGTVLLQTLPLVLVGAFSYVGLHYLLWVAARRPAGFESRVLEFLRMLLAYWQRSKLARSLP